jgi:hypothetical protein
MQLAPLHYGVELHHRSFGCKREDMQLYRNKFAAAMQKQKVIATASS